ncbi:PREDICTED: probable aldo-keto reductase 1 isoform X1 [Prunus mume]|uniref:Probable aldo-keto reductase 1 isoform X1 n=1 Tax=Prunus mume TaxID=102107 RepID=A0ABM0N1T3_PRUMU|nr:PREDICTED: probable aldo-keto reductase 1 isoform X1 [Prunus mume]
MTEGQGIQIPRVELGTQGFEVSKLGFGCMGLSWINSPEAEKEGISLIKDAFSKGITFFDTSDIYGTDHYNEILVGKALKQLPREKVQIATKFGVVSLGPPCLVVRGDPQYVRVCCESSLKRLGVDYIDLYYQHRVDQSVPIEDTMGELKKLVEEGKIKYIGLSEASPDTIRRAHAVHPITAIQMEWSLWTRDIEEEIVPLCRERGIGIVPYSPLGRGFFAGKAVLENLDSEVHAATHPRMTGENLEKNKHIYHRVESLAKKHECSPAQLALSWVLHRGNDVVPIPGTTKIKNLDTNIGSVALKLREEDLKEISDAVPLDQVAGEKTYERASHVQWKFANTPQRNPN